MPTVTSLPFEETVRQALREVMPELPDLVGPADGLFALGLDSLRVVEYLLKIETEFGIEFDLADISFASFGTIGAITSLITEKLDYRKSA